MLRNITEIQGTMWDILCDTCEEILGLFCNMYKDVLNSLNGYLRWHSPGLRRRSCQLPFMGATHGTSLQRTRNPSLMALAAVGKTAEAHGKTER